MNQEIKIAVCDDLAEDRENITRLLSEYTDKNNLYVKIEEFSSGEAFFTNIFLHIGHAPIEYLKLINSKISRPYN